MGNNYSLKIVNARLIAPRRCEFQLKVSGESTNSIYVKLTEIDDNPNFGKSIQLGEDVATFEPAMRDGEIKTFTFIFDEAAAPNSKLNLYVQNNNVKNAKDELQFYA